MSQPEPSRLTRALRHGIGQDTQHRAVVPAWYPSTNYTFPTIGEEPDYAYSRSANPTRDALQAQLAAMERGGS